MPQPCLRLSTTAVAGEPLPLRQDTAPLTLVQPRCPIPMVQAVVEEVKRAIIAEERLVLKYCQERAARLKSEVKPLEYCWLHTKYPRRGCRVARAYLNALADLPMCRLCALGRVVSAYTTLAWFGGYSFLQRLPPLLLLPTAVAFAKHETETRPTRCSRILGGYVETSDLGYAAYRIAYKVGFAREII